MWLSRTIAARQRAERESAAADMGVRRQRLCDDEG